MLVELSRRQFVVAATLGMAGAAGYVANLARKAREAARRAADL